jgi:hypothetical protein
VRGRPGSDAGVADPVGFCRAATTGGAAGLRPR